jgi:hypothetical protein
MLMASYSPGRYLSYGLGLLLAAGAFFYSRPAATPDTLMSDASAFDASPTCRATRVLTEEADPLALQAAPGMCVLQSVAISAKHAQFFHSLYRGRWSAVYFLTVTLPWGGERETILEGDRGTYDQVIVGQKVMVLFYNRRPAVIAIGGQTITTKDDPDIVAPVQKAIWTLGAICALCGVLLLLRAYCGSRGD